MTEPHNLVVPGTGLEPASQLRRRIFVTLLLSKPAPRGAVRALDYAFAIAHEPCCRSCALGAPRLVSTPSPPPLLLPLRGLARRCLGASRARGFAEFEGFCTGRFRPGTQSFKSAMFTNFITPARADAILPLLARAFPIRSRKCSPITRDPAPSASAPRARRIDQVVDKRAHLGRHVPSLRICGMELQPRNRPVERNPDLFTASPLSRYRRMPPRPRSHSPRATRPRAPACRCMHAPKTEMSRRCSRRGRSPVGPAASR